MSSPYKNIFFYYRGPKSRKFKNIESRDRQLEDNATKALINVLEHAERSIVLKKFLKTFAGFNISKKEDQVQFALQRVDIRQPNIKRKLIITIGPKKGWSRNRSNRTQKGRPDAWIWNGGDFGILLETKLYDQPNKAQIQRHIRSADGWRKNYTIRQTTWDELSKFFSTVLRDKRTLNDNLTCHLVSQLKEFLKMAGLTSEPRFDSEDFAFFLTSPENRTSYQRKSLESRILKFIEVFVETRTGRTILNLYGEKVNPRNCINPGVFRHEASAFWVTIGPKDRRNSCHLNFRIGQDGIDLECFSPHRSFTKKLMKKIQKDADGFLNTVRNIMGNEKFFFRLREAHYKDAGSSYKGQRIGRINDFLTVHPRELRVENLNQILIDPIFRRLKKRALRPEIFLVRRFGLEEIIGNESIMEGVKKTARQMKPYLKYALKV